MTNSDQNRISDDQHNNAPAVPHGDTVEIIGMKGGKEHFLGTMAMPPRMKAREIAREQFGHFVDDDGSDAELCFVALEQLIDHIQKHATPAPAPAQEPETALQKFTRFKVAETEGNPVEMLRAFCAFAMNSQDWFDVEPFFDLVREAMASRTAVAPAQPIGRTELEIVEQTEELAAFLMDWRWGQAPESPSVKFRSTENVKAQKCWAAACHIQEMITATDVENAVAEVDDDPEPDAAPAQEVALKFPVVADPKQLAHMKECFEHVKAEVGTKGWVEMDFCNYMGFFMWGFEAARQSYAGHQPAATTAQEVGLTDEERQQVFRAAENRMVREINLSWRTAVVDEVIAALRAKGGKL